jgi:hypothetical protein
MDSGQETETGKVGAVVLAERDRIEAALTARDREALDGLAVDAETLVEELFPPAFVDANTDFPDLETFLDTAGAGTVWELAGWLDWVLDWHVLGNTRFWSWEWLVHAAVVVRAAAASAGPVRCSCGGAVAPVTASDVEEPGRADDRWVEYRCGACGGRGRMTHSPDGAASLDGLERP